MFGITPKKPPQTIIEQIKDDFDSESISSKESDEPEQQKQPVRGQSMFPGGQKGMSALEEAVLKRRRAMGDLDVPPEDDEDDKKKPAKTSNDTM